MGGGIADYDIFDVQKASCLGSGFLEGRIKIVTNRNHNGKFLVITCFHLTISRLLKERIITPESPLTPL